MSWRIGAAAILLAVLAPAAGSDDGFRIAAIQHRGWWELRYPDGIVAANELHVPAGRRVTIDATLDGGGLLWFDDGHLPRIGRHATIAFTASRGDDTTARAFHLQQPRTAELAIIADEQFDAWLAHQRSAANPASSEGRDVFLTARCTLCHSVRGIVTAEQPDGPDLTHLGSRRRLAAGAFPNRTGYLAGWVVDAEQLKPGCGMPVNNIDSDRLQALLAFLQTLR